MFTVRTDRPWLASEASQQLLAVELTLPRPAAEAVRRAVHLSLVLDRSGSMAGQKLRLAIEAAVQAVRSLAEGDRFSVVTFDDKIDVPVPSTAASSSARTRAEAALLAIEAGDATDLAAGWLRGCAEIAAFLPEEAIGRCLVLTDGQANHGITAPDELTRLARDHRRGRVTTSTLGLGDGFNEFLLGRLSEEGGGNFWFAERADQIAGLVAQELGGVLSVAARDASLIVEAPADVQVESLNDYPCAREGAAHVFTLGSLAGGQSLTPMFRLHVPAGPVGQRCRVSVRFSDPDEALPREPWTVEFVRGPAEQVARAARDVTVTRPAAAVDAARARRAALEQNRSGEREASQARLAAAASLLRSYADGDPEILAIAARLEVDRAEYARPMSSLRSKDSYYKAMRRMKMGLADEAAVIVIPLEDPLVPAIDAAVLGLGRAKGAPSMAVDRSLLGRRGGSGPLTEDEERLLVAQAHALGESSVKVVFSERALVDAWFSHWHEPQRTAVVSLHDLRRIGAVQATAFVAYELVLYGLHALSATYAARTSLHAETRACLFDLCRDKGEIRIKLQAGHVCAECLQKLPGLGLDVDAVIRQWKVVQALAQAKAP